MRGLCWMAFVGGALALFASMASAESKKGPDCSYQLAQKTVEAQNLDSDRDAKEQKLAQAQVTIYLQAQTQKALESQIAELKKKLEELTPKTDDKPDDKKPE